MVANRERNAPGDIELRHNRKLFHDWCHVLINGAGVVNKWKCELGTFARVLRINIDCGLQGLLSRVCTTFAASLRTLLPGMKPLTPAERRLP
jgi:hypothetical protein